MMTAIEKALYDNMDQGGLAWGLGVERVGEKKTI